MDLGIKGRRAIVCASSKGLGRACAMALANEGVHVTLTARGAEALKKTADEIRKANPGVTVTEVAGDITTPAGREAALKACPDPDILINNAGGPPPGDFRNWTRDDWIKAIDANMLTPIELIKATVTTSPSTACCRAPSTPTVCAARSRRWMRRSAASPWTSCWRSGPNSIPPDASATRKNSASPARFSVAQRRASSPDRTSCSMAAPSRARCK